MSEDSLHITVAEWLNLALPPDSAWHHSPNENKAHVAWRQKLKKRGTCAGWPDIEIIYQGKIYFIELKYGKNKVSDKQKLCHDYIMRGGAPVAVCYTLFEVQEALVLAFNIKLRSNIKLWV